MDFRAVLDVLEKTVLSLPENEHRFFRRLALSLVTILTELSRSLHIQSGPEYCSLYIDIGRN